MANRGSTAAGLWRAYPRKHITHSGVRLENGKYPTLSLFFVQAAIY